MVLFCQSESHGCRNGQRTDYYHSSPSKKESAWMSEIYIWIYQLYLIQIVATPSFRKDGRQDM